MTLSGAGEYNLDILKEIEVTNSFDELDTEVKNCRSYKSNGSYDSCTTGYFHGQMLLNCGCIPYAISNSTNNKVWDTCKLSLDN